MGSREKTFQNASRLPASVSSASRRKARKNWIANSAAALQFFRKISNISKNVNKVQVRFASVINNYTLNSEKPITDNSRKISSYKINENCISFVCVFRAQQLWLMNQIAIFFFCQYIDCDLICNYFCFSSGSFSTVKHKIISTISNLLNRNCSFVNAKLFLR